MLQQLIFKEGPFQQVSVISKKNGFTNQYMLKLGEEDPSPPKKRPNITPPVLKL